MSNRQIADRLTLSVRTVEGHLYRACAKLGVSDRAELAPSCTATEAVRTRRRRVRVADYSYLRPSG
ncbi:MAG TPA: helix-turn-helix transcriptional regulator [Pseudonocardiaceae bacterium]|nr:helix-turn-helix transcriptional regulator [Pseudonocardiaceae bacterium]